MTQLSTFQVRPYQFGVDVRLVQEIVRLPALTPVPLASTDIAGLINLRGEVLTVIDLRSRLGLPRLGVEAAMLVVVKVDDEPVSLLVDAIAAVIEVSVEREQIPPTVPPRLRGLLLGAYPLAEHLLLELDVRKVLGIRSASHAAFV